MNESNKTSPFTEIELQRAMGDHANRLSCAAQGQQRHASVHRLLAKIQTLSDSDFEMAYGALESLVDGLYTKKLKEEKTPQKDSPESALALFKK